MPDGPVIIDNTPLVALFVLKMLALLRDLFGEVWIPEAVWDEFLATDRAARKRALSEQPNLVLVSLSNQRNALMLTGLDRGETEVLALAQERAARLVILDERKGRRLAKRLQIPVTGTLGVLLLAKERGLLDRIGPPIAMLQEAGLYLHPSLIARALTLAQEE